MNYAPSRPDSREWRRRLIPATTVAAASLAITLPLPLAWGLMPNLALLLILVWASVQPRLMPIWAAFLLGLLHDIFTAGPFGLFGLLFPLTVLAVRAGDGRLRTRMMRTDWLLAAILILALHVLAWQLFALIGQPQPPLPLLAQGVVTAFAFPLALALAALLHRRLVEEA